MLVDKIPNMDDEERIEEEIVDVLIMIWKIKYNIGTGLGADLYVAGSGIQSVHHDL